VPPYGLGRSSRMERVIPDLTKISAEHYFAEW
jgi:hypothetical protein